VQLEFRKQPCASAKGERPTTRDWGRGKEIGRENTKSVLSGAGWERGKGWLGGFRLDLSSKKEIRRARSSTTGPSEERKTISGSREKGKGTSRADVWRPGGKRRIASSASRIEESLKGRDRVSSQEQDRADDLQSSRVAGKPLNNRKGTSHGTGWRGKGMIFRANAVFRKAIETPGGSSLKRQGRLESYQEKGLETAFGNAFASTILEVAKTFHSF